MSQTVKIKGHDYSCRVPTMQGWDRLADAVGEDDSRMHWGTMFSWCFEEDHDYQSSHALRGHNSARFRTYHSSDIRYPDWGFRPAFEPLASDDLEPGAADGETVPVGTLYMDGRPVRVPKNPTKDGDIEDYIPGATLEIKAPLSDRSYQIRAVKTGDVLVADRNLLKRITWDDLEEQGLC